MDSCLLSFTSCTIDAIFRSDTNRRSSSAAFAKLAVSTWD